MSLAGLSLETATRRTGGFEEDLTDSMRERMEEMAEERCLARAGSTRISAVSDCPVSVMIVLICQGFVASMLIEGQLCSQPR